MDGRNDEQAVTSELGPVTGKFEGVGELKFVNLNS
jgi:hypothetical protein